MKCDRSCGTQCDGCHTLSHCVQAATRRGDLLLCRSCARRFDAGDGIRDINAEWQA